MIIEYFKKRNARVPSEITLHNGKGRSVAIKLKEPIEVEDSWGHKILAENGDIIRQVIASPPPPEKKRTRAKKTK